MEPNSLITKTAQLLSFYHITASQLRQNISDYFNEGELRNLCFDIGTDYENLLGSTKSDRARELITWCMRQGLMEELLMKCGELRPHVFPASNFTQLSGMNFPQATKVYKVVEEQVQQDEYAAATFARLSVQPNSQSRQVALAAILAELTEKDPDFANLSHTHQVDCAIAPFNGGGVKNAIAKPLQNLLNAFFAAMSIVDFHSF